MIEQRSKGLDVKVSATLKYARISPQKCRLVMHAIRGNEVLQALRIIKFMPQKAAKIITKVLESAVANAENNHGADLDDLKISQAYADEAPTFKRFRARARGRGTRILKRNSHITIELSDD